MEKQETNLRNMLQNADMEAVEQIAAQFPAADDAARERIFKGIQAKQQMQDAVSIKPEAETVPTITRRHYRSIWAAAACLLICGGIVGGAALHRPLMTQQETETTTETTAQTERETEAEAEAKPETQVQTNAQEQPASAAISSEETEVVTEVQTEVQTETVVVTVAAEEIVQTAPAEVTQPVESIVQETAPAQTGTETVQPETEAVRTEETVQNEFIFLQETEIPGYTLYHEEGVRCWFYPTEDDMLKEAVVVRYAPAYLPEGVSLNEEMAAVEEQRFATAQRDGYRTYCYERWYDPAAAEDGTFLYSSFYIITAQEVILETKDSRTFLEANVLFAPVMIGENRGFIAKEEHAEDYIQYTLFWMQDGYLFSINTSNIPETYLPELIKIAESVQPIE